eukprot:GILJ01008742.1.p1 GENE.GILJ01008742.1~~GILJ01008742.1.p1  ORF type:complete len:592 (-),score=76.34 GILJ01008742.1:251-2026(-)
MSNLKLAIVGNCTYNALVDTQACVHWCCMPRFDGDPVFCTMLRKEKDLGFFDVLLDDFLVSEQKYVKNSAILSTTLLNKTGDAVEIVDFAPRFKKFGRFFLPNMFIRKLVPVKGLPRIRIRLRPTFGYGWGTPEKTRGSNHIRYLLPTFTLRLTTNAPVSYIDDETAFLLEEPIYLILMPDESLMSSPAEVGEEFYRKTLDSWTDWSQQLSIPYEWQDAVLRSSITVKLCAFEETGAIMAAATTSIPTGTDNNTTSDYRYCWIRDACNSVRTLNSLSATQTMESYIRYIQNITSMDAEHGGMLAPVYGIALEHRLVQRDIDRLPGYRGKGPVRIGNQDWQKVDHGVFGQVVLAVSHVFFDRRVSRPGDISMFNRLELLGERALAFYDKPDHLTFPWADPEKRVHVYSAAMCWAACDRLATIAGLLQLPDRCRFWRTSADSIRASVLEGGWNAESKFLSRAFNEGVSDVTALLLPEIGFLPHNHEYFLSTLAHIENTYLRDGFIVPDPVKSPDTGSIVATFWYIDAVRGVGRAAEARKLFDHVLEHGTELGLFSENISISTHELWGNFPCTASGFHLIKCAATLSQPWHEVV